MNLYLNRAKIAAAFLLCMLALSGCVKAVERSGFDEYDWPMERFGRTVIKLNVPAAHDVLGGAKNPLQHTTSTTGQPLVRQAIVLNTLWPTFEQRNPGNSAEFQRPGGGKMLSILIESSATKDASDLPTSPRPFPPAPEFPVSDRAIFSNVLIGWTSVKIDSNKSFCNSYQASDPPDWKQECYKVDKLAHKKDFAGLKSIGVDFSQFPKLNKDDMKTKDNIFYAPSLDEHIQVLVTCTAWEIVEGAPHGPDELGYSPHCSQKFIFKPLNALVTVNYRREFLGDWRAIQAATEKLLQSFMLSK